MPVPKAVDPDGSHRVSTLMVYRQHLPDAKLSRDLFPLLVLEQEDCVAMILPCEFWPLPLLQEWGMPE